MKTKVCADAVSVSVQSFLRIEWSPGWSIFVRQIMIPLALLAGLLLSGSADHLEAALKQVLNLP